MSVPVEDFSSLGFPSAICRHSEDKRKDLSVIRDFLKNHREKIYSVNNPQGIDELKKIVIDDSEQWLHVRGQDRANPVLLYLHGGPGEPMIGYMDAIQRPWEDYFTVVHWDQRGTGKSYMGSREMGSEVSIDLYINDAEAVIKNILEFLDKDRLFIVGHSWGSVLGMHIAIKHPQWLYGYVGVGQIVNMLEGEKALYKRLIYHARESGKNEIVEKVSHILLGLESHSPQREKSFSENCGYVREQLSQLGRETAARHWSRQCLTEIINIERLFSPHLTDSDICNIVNGEGPVLVRPENYSGLTKQFIDVDLPAQLGSSFDIPIFFFSGRHDYQVPVTLSDKWFSVLEAPYKKIIHFEESSHVVVNEEPGKFLYSLVNEVLPFANSFEKQIGNDKGAV